MIYDGVSIDPEQLYSQQEVIAILNKGSSADCDLVAIRNNYDKKFGSELIYRYPHTVGMDLGVVLTPVKEGFLCIPFNEMDSEDYEIFEPDKASLLSAGELKSIKKEWDRYTRGLSSALSSMWKIQHAREKK